MNKEWVVKSLTLWGVFVAILSALIPALTVLFPQYADTLTLEWLAGLDASVKAAITSIGTVISAVLILYDRFSGNTSKQLVLRRMDAEEPATEKKS